MPKMQVWRPEDDVKEKQEKRQGKKGIRTGVIKFYSEDRGFGFIAQDKGDDLFFHISSANVEPERLRKGQHVSYEVTQGKKGLQARELSIEKVAEEAKQKKKEQHKEGIGVIKFYNENKKFGFITSSVGKDPFFHIRSVIEKPENIEPGQSAEYGIAQGGKGLKAKKVIIKKNLGKLYIQKQIRLKTPMVFETYTQSIPCVVKKNLTYDIDLLCSDEERRIQKHNIKYCYKQEYENSVKANIQFDEKIKAKKLEPITHRKDRYQIPNKSLRKAKAEKKTIRLVLRGGEILLGTIEWFSTYEIKVGFGSETTDETSTGNVIAFRHAAYDFDISSEPQKEEISETDATVYITFSGSTYHRKGCQYIKQGAKRMKKSEAKKHGYTACQVCLPD